MNSFLGMHVQNKKKKKKIEPTSYLHVLLCSGSVQMYAKAISRSHIGKLIFAIFLYRRYMLHANLSSNGRCMNRTKKVQHIHPHSRRGKRLER